jgi:ATP-dependent DNA ligase
MDRFVRRENIKRYWNLLRGAKDEAGRRLIKKLLIEEEQKEVAGRTSSRSAARADHVSSEHEGGTENK